MKRSIYIILAVAVIGTTVATGFIWLMQNPNFQPYPIMHW